jgi:threonine aldolase
VGELAHEYSLRLHIDGARIFNSAVAQNVSVRELVAPADSVMFCLSKGLASPVGSMLVGSRGLIKRARHLRKMLGGGMRQVGVLAAAGIISLESMIERLDDDHARARKLAEGLNSIPGIQIDPGSPATNMVYFNLAEGLPNAGELTTRLKRQGILVDPDGARRFRLVTHYWIDDEGVAKAVNGFREALAS